MLLLYQATEYEPYRPRAQWWKQLDKVINIYYTQKINTLVHRAYLYLMTDCKKRERNLKKDRHKKKWNYSRTIRVRAVLLAIITARTRGSAHTTR